MSEIIIRKEEYFEETNSTMERQEANTSGPLNPNGNGERIPYDGFEDEEGNTYRLIGFAKLKRPVLSLDRDMTAWLQKVLGKGYWIFNRSDSMKGALASRIKVVGAEAVKRDWKVAKEIGLGAVQAIQYASSPPVDQRTEAKQAPKKMPVSAAIPKRISEPEITGLGDI